MFWEKKKEVIFPKIVFESTVFHAYGSLNDSLFLESYRNI